MTDWPLVSVVVVTYNRLQTLAPTIEAFKRLSTYPRLEFVLCDDGSPPPVRAAMRDLPFDQFLFADRNEGIGRNTNKGIAAARGGYILQLQDDWVCEGRGDFVERAMTVLLERPEIDMVRYRERLMIRPTSTVTSSMGDSVQVFTSGTFARDGGYAYTDNPHLKRRSLHARLGSYKERVPMTEAEIDFCVRVDRDDRTKVAIIDGCYPFRHIGDDLSYNPSARRGRLKARLESFGPTRWLVRAYQLRKAFKRTPAT